ncbi:pyruvate kinase [Pseudarthrobacter oxydans]|uniref:pyruvate kinase n=1 Tax=Pseudarthrobacter oxydans TaxID=1671 RepID=UPI0027821415|nr:pyruvate kinase [Pseudarthrobacter oxydans]MDP9983994.1 pyruvate kinase [Pseudarthrobacter oxydans]
MSTAEIEDLRALLEEVIRLRRSIKHAETRSGGRIDAVRPRHRESALNLVHYTELRRHDIRDLQARLSKYGLSSLGRTESHVLPSIETLIWTLGRLVNPDGEHTAAPAGFPDGGEQLARNAVNILGPKPEDRSTRIMVTLPSEAATDAALVRGMVERGMDLARINCAHDGPQAWRHMVDHIRAAENSTGKRCLVAMDLAGPKLRTGPVRPGPRVLRVKPIRSKTGTVLEPGRVWLGAALEPAPDAAPPPELPVIPLENNAWAGSQKRGQKIRFKDARGARRTLDVEQTTPTGCLVTLEKTAYFTPGTKLTAVPDPAAGKKGRASRRPSVRVGELPALQEGLLIHQGDNLVLSSDLAPADSTSTGKHRIGCTLASALADARAGERIWFDDGKIGGVITAVGPGELTARITSAAPQGTRLRAGKGINLPDSRLTVSALTEQDVADLEHVRELSDIVSMSFVRSALDVRELLAHLDPERDRNLDILLKIETVAAFKALPDILLELMKWADVGVMIARGDLAVEAGFERLAEVQEEILWLCEAAHVPVIWATQVLDTLARTGMPSRAEVTDAAMAQRAECVMLNKGPFINEAISMLADILGRMQDHTQKKSSLLRRLRAWDQNGTGALEAGTDAGQEPDTAAGAGPSWS